MERINNSEIVLGNMLDSAKKYLVEPISALDLFCGDGSLISRKLFQSCSDYTGIDVNEEKVKSLQDAFPAMNFICMDSIKWLKEESTIAQYNLVLVDNPLGLFGDDDIYCEHFDLLQYISRVCTENFVLVLDVVPKPYNAGDIGNSNWMNRRKALYKEDNVMVLNIGILQTFYKQYFNNLGMQVGFLENKCREWHNGNDYFHFFYFEISK